MSQLRAGLRSRLPRGPGLVIVWLASALALAATARSLAVVGNLRPIMPTVAAFFLAIAVGEWLRFRITESRELAPMSLASALAFALLSGPLTSAPGPSGIPVDLVRPGEVLSVTALAMAVGAAPHLARRRALPADEIAARYLAVAAVAILFRGIPLWRSRTLLAIDAGWTGPRWPIALILATVSGLGLLLYLVLTAVVIAAREHRELRPTIADQIRTGAGLGLALGATGTLVALAARPLGVLALPLFLIPLLLTQFALRQYGAIHATYGQTVRVLARITDAAGFTRAGHAERVAALAVEIGRDLGLPELQTRNLEYAALLHDVGQVSLREPIPAGATVMAAPADQTRIAMNSAEVVRKAGVAAEVIEAVERQAVPYRVVREAGERLSVLARIVKVANAYDDFVGGSITARRREAAIERIQLGLGYEYDPRVVEALVRVLAREPRSGR